MKINICGYCITVERVEKFFLISFKIFYCIVFFILLFYHIISNNTSDCNNKALTQDKEFQSWILDEGEDRCEHDILD
jgi:hypothetical protein